MKSINEKGMVFGSVLALTLTPSLNMPFAFSELWLYSQMEIYLTDVM